MILGMKYDLQLQKGSKWKGINCKQSTRWQHLSRLKAGAFFSLQNFFSCYETQQLIRGTGTAIWWVTEPHWRVRLREKECEGEREGLIETERNRKREIGRERLRGGEGETNGMRESEW